MPKRPPRRTHYSEVVDRALCNAHLNIEFIEDLKATNNPDLVNCGNCLKLMAKPYHRGKIYDKKL